MIAENDDARGVLQLSSSTYDATESSQNFVTVTREAGSFGTVCTIIDLLLHFQYHYADIATHKLWIVALEEFKCV